MRLARTLERRVCTRVGCVADPVDLELYGPVRRYRAVRRAAGMRTTAQMAFRMAIHKMGTVLGQRMV